MAIMDQTAIDDVAKDLYPQKDINRLVIADSPLAGLVKKRTDFVGRRQLVGLRYALPAGRSASFTQAQSSEGPSKLEGFYVTRVKDYAVASIDTETIRSTKGDKGALVDALDFELKGAMEALKKSLNQSLYRNHGGSIGRLSAGTVSGTGPFTLATPEDIVHFDVGMVLAADTTDGTSGTVHSGTATVAKVDRNNGQFYTSANFDSGIASISNTDYLFQAGDFGVKMAGLASWVPTTLTSTSFFGVDRTVDYERLGGIRISAQSGAPIEQQLMYALGVMSRNPGKPSHIFLNTMDWMQLAISMHSRLMLSREQGTEAEIGYDAIVIAGPKGLVKVLGDPYCPKGFAYITQLDTWCLWTLGDIGFLDDDGLKMLRSATADQYQFRLGYYGNLVCDAPGYNAVVTL